MSTATQTLAAIVAALIAKVGDDDGKLGAAMAEFQPAADADTAAAAALDDRVTALEAAVTALPPAADLGPLEGRVTALEDAPKPEGAAPTETVDLTPLEEAIADHGTRIEALEARPVAPSVVHEETITGGGALTPALGADSLPTAQVGAPYAAQVGVSGGVAPYQFSIANGALPPGLSLQAGGAITGTPTEAGEFTTGIQVNDANGTLATEGYSFSVAAAA